MIKLQELLEDEKQQHSSFYSAYMHSKQGFGCHVCRYYYIEKGVHRCNNEEYIEYMGTEDLLTKRGGDKINDPSQYCSNWFKPND